MNKILGVTLCVSSFWGCSHPKPAASGKRFSLAKGNISFVLPDSSLTYSKPILWPADFSRGEYGEAGAFYHNQDSTTQILVYVKAYPDAFQGRVPWRVVADEAELRQSLLAQNHGFATIEEYKADSSARTITIDYHLINKQERGWRSQASYNKNIVVHGRHRIIRFWLSGPDNAVTRQQFAAAQASIWVAPAYLQDTVAAHQSKAMRD